MVIAAALLMAGPTAPAGNAEATTVAAKVTDPVPMMELLAPGGKGRLYTLSTAEAAAAVSLYGFTRQAGQVGHWRMAAFTGSQPVYRLRSGSSYLLTASASERDSLAATGRFEVEGVAGHLAQRHTAGTKRLMRFSRSGEWRVAFEDHSQELIAAGYRVDRALGWAPRVDSRRSHLFRHVQPEVHQRHYRHEERLRTRRRLVGRRTRLFRRRSGRTEEHPGLGRGFLASEARDRVLR
ncbi:hypothetical protein ACFQGX_51085 [Nonomuraea dietziae]|uniref:hypothetical protein n=1 Tax=Nonomuraea dietziae TaxID=65515 RepID=UPI0036069B8E